MQEWVLEITVVEAEIPENERTVLKATDVFNAMFQACKEVGKVKNKRPNAQIERVDLTLFSA